MTVIWSGSPQAMLDHVSAIVRGEQRLVETPRLTVVAPPFIVERPRPIDAPMRKGLERERVRDRWTTPRWLVRMLEDQMGGPIELDVAAEVDNSVAPLFICRAQDALSMERWPRVRRAFCNPPFGGGQLLRFISKCIEHVYGWRIIQQMAVVTLADVSTRYWRALEEAGAERARFAGGRWTCDPPPGVKVSSPRAAMQAWILRAPMSVSEAIALYGTDDERARAARRSK